MPLFFHRRTIQDPEGAPDEWKVDKVLGHRTKPNGEYQFLTQWCGYGEDEATWEPISHFFHRYNSDLVKYCQGKGIAMEVMAHLSPEPMAE